jgi:hypothetical protein
MFQSFIYKSNVKYKHKSQKEVSQEAQCIRLEHFQYK